MIGYLLGAPKPGEVWGPNVWVEAAGQATEDAETMRDLYALAAAHWVDEGRVAQYVLVPSHDRDLVDAWFRLGFGQQHVHAIRPVPEPGPGRSQQRGRITVRRAVAADIPVLARLDVELPLHQSLSPTFSAAPPGTVEESEAEWADDIDDPEYTTFVAERDGKVVGSAVGCSVEKSGAHKGVSRPDDAGFLGFASVFPDARGSGAGRALGEAVLDWAAAQGYASVVTDWRATNLLSSRAWPALGFTESFLRLHRLVGY
jgi:GNAT superfamily N-acetyltransferase